MWIGSYCSGNTYTLLIYHVNAVCTVLLAFKRWLGWDFSLDFAFVCRAYQADRKAGLGEKVVNKMNELLFSR